jgi:hypothetical protein
MIKNFEDFLGENERTRTRTYNEPRFIDEAIKALTNAGFVVTNKSTPRQKNNDNLACEITFPSVLVFMKEYYGIGEERVVCSNLTRIIENHRYDTVIYKIGNVITPGSSSPDFKFVSIPELVENLKRYMTASLISGSKLGSREDKQSYKVFPNDIRIDKKNTYTTRWAPGVGNEIGIAPIRKKLPVSAVSILNKIFDNFSKYYSQIYSISPEYLEYATDLYCAFIEFYYMEIADTSTTCKITADLANVSSPDNEHNWIPMINNSTNVRKEKTHMKVSYYGDQTSFHTSNGYKDLKPYLDKFRDFSEEKLDSYFSDYLTTKRGMIAGKKFGL